MSLFKKAEDSHFSTIGRYLGFGKTAEAVETAPMSAPPSDNGGMVEQADMEKECMEYCGSLGQEHNEMLKKYGPPKVQQLEKDAVAPPGWEGTVKHLKKHKEVSNPWALSWWMKDKGYKSHK
jgi:hypothetical protein